MREWLRHVLANVLENVCLKTAHGSEHYRIGPRKFAPKEKLRKQRATNNKVYCSGYRRVFFMDPLENHWGFNETIRWIDT